LRPALAGDFPVNRCLSFPFGLNPNFIPFFLAPVVFGVSGGVLRGDATEMATQQRGKAPIMPKLASFLASGGEGSPPALAFSPMRGDSKGIGVLRRFFVLLLVQVALGNPV
jgi:hypothetical protein